MMKMGSSYWNVSDFEVMYKNQTSSDDVPTTAKMDLKFVTPTPLHFSFHCYEPPPVRSANLTTHDITIVFRNLQAIYCIHCVDSL